LFSLPLSCHVWCSGMLFVVCFFVCLFSCLHNPLWLYFPQPSSGILPPRFRGFLITHDAPQLGLLWASDQFVAGTSTRQHNLTTDKHPCLRWDSNPRSQQASGRRPTS
jgi:hypothetical protein